MSPIRVVSAATACLLLVGCASRPSEADLAGSILAAANASGSTVTLTEAQASCIARALLDSGLSDTTLAGLAEDFDQPQVLKTEVDRVEPIVAEAAVNCQ